jgi:[calcium/calmodulin-dependent protein kinase] kinase
MKRKKRILMKGKGTTSQWENVLQEIYIMKMLSTHPHQNVVQLYEVIETRDKLHIFMEYLPGGPVMAGKAEVEPFKDMERIRRYLRDLVMGLEHLHALGVVHMDIKPENLILDSEDRLKIIDFGVAMIVKGDSKIRKYQGTPAFTPPETIADGPFMPWPLDVWAVGITLYIFGHGSPPFHEEGISFQHLYDLIQMEEPKFNTALDADYISCIESCLMKNPDERTTLRSLKTHQWVTKFGKDPVPNQEFPKLRLTSDDCKSALPAREISDGGYRSRGKRKA